MFGSGLKSPHKKTVFFVDFALQNMVETTLPDGLEISGQRANFGISLDVFEFSVLDDFFCCSKKLGFWVFLVHPETTLPNGLETPGRRVYR